MKLYRIRITTGPNAGRYVGPNIGGLVTNKELLENREVKVPGTKYSLYAQEGAANKYFENPAAGVQAELKAKGYESELVEA
jgi:hypothetical protein